MRELYPLVRPAPQNPKRAQPQPGDPMPKVKVIIGTWTTTVAPAPSQAPIAVGTEGYDKLVRGKKVLGRQDDKVVNPRKHSKASSSTATR